MKHFNPQSNARQPGESFDKYVERRKKLNTMTKRLLRGTFCHISAQIVGVPLPMDEQQAKDIERGRIRNLTPPMIQPDGKLIRLGVTKGVTFAYPDRKAHRKTVLAERRAR